MQDDTAGLRESQIEDPICALRIVFQNNEWLVSPTTHMTMPTIWMRVMFDNVSPRPPALPHPPLSPAISNNH
jgi:hypothetical protein